jgi:aminoglycoside phosphotransferase family enzyme
MHRAPTAIQHHDTSLIDSRMTTSAFDHPVSTIEMIETHISWVILTDRFVYKIKKPLTLDFLDFGDLEKRRFFCEEEVRLNKPWAPDIYVDVVGVTIVDGQPRFTEKGEAIEYAVRMRPFDQALRLDRQLDDGLLTVIDMKELAQNIAARHHAAPKVAASQRRRILRLTGQFMHDNFTALDGQVDNTQLAHLEAWTGRQLALYETLLGRRFDEGFVRDCHGDLHLGNLVRLPGGITTFDSIEFNADLRQIDTMCDIAFLVMDLVARDRPDLAAHFLNRYLEVNGDYEGIALLNMFFVYRCLVRAKVAVIRSQERDSQQERDADLEEAHFYCDMATRQAAVRQPVLIIMHGLSGSGKTWVSGELMAALPAIRIRTDIERKRLFGIGEFASSESGVAEGIYSEEANAMVYSRLLDVARSVLCSGHSVILDAAFLKENERADAMRIADECDCPATIIDVTAPHNVLRDRVSKRARQGSDPSEAGLDVLEYQLTTVEALSATEWQKVIECDTAEAFNVAELVNQITTT